MDGNNAAERIKAQLAELQGRESYNPDEALPGTSNQGSRNTIADILAARLSEQASGISSSASSNLQASINNAISGTQTAGELSRRSLMSERDREVAFARNRQGAEITGALEGRTGYGTQRIALRELAETTEKEVKDLRQRYDELILQGDAATAQRVAELQVQKLEFLQAQEQNFYSNMIGVANLQQEALSQAQQNEQFYQAQQQADRQFRQSMQQSKYEFEQNYGLELERIDLQQQQIELQRQRNQISAAEYQLKRDELNNEKTLTNLEALVTQDIKNKVASGEFTLEDFQTTEYLAQVRANTGFDGDVDELSGVVNRSWNAVNSDETFMSDLNSGTVETARTGGVAGVVGGTAPFFSTVGSLYGEAIFGVPEGQQPTGQRIGQSIGNFFGDIGDYGPNPLR